MTIEREHLHPKDDPDSLGADILDCPDIYGLGVITQPITKVDSFDIKFAKFLAPSSAGHQQIKKGIFNVAMSPILTFNAGCRGCDTYKQLDF